MALSKMMIRNGRLWNGEAFVSGDVYIENGRIADIGEIEPLTDTFVYDAKGLLVSAGLVDIHTHMKGISCDAFGIPADGACFPFGVTGAADASAGFGNRERLEAFAVKNVVFVAVDIQDNKVDLSGLEELIDRYGERTVGIKVFFDGRDGQVQSTAPLKAVCEYAHKMGMKVMVHTSGTPVAMREVFECLHRGDICTHVYHGGEHTILEDSLESFWEAKNRGVVMDVGMAGGVNTDFWVLGEAFRMEAFPNTISSDITSSSAFIRGGRYGLNLCMSAMRHMGMQEEAIFRAVTADPAKALGKEQDWGRLEIGRCADLAVLGYGNCGFDLTDGRGNRMQSSMGYECMLTVSDGQVVYSK